MNISFTEAARLGLINEERVPLKKLTKKQKGVFKGRKRKTVKLGSANPLFDSYCKAHGLAAPEYEYPFNKEAGDLAFLRPSDGKPYEWRFDYLFDGLVAIECQGGVWTQGRHSRGEGQTTDMLKFNAAQCLGYIVLLFTPEQMESGEFFPILKKALGSSE